MFAPYCLFAKITPEFSGGGLARSLLQRIVITKPIINLTMLHHTYLRLLPHHNFIPHQHLPLPSPHPTFFHTIHLTFTVYAVRG